MPRRAAAAAHWRVSGVVGHTTATRWTARSRSSARASSSAGRVLPAPGAAETRNGPAVHARIAASACRCQDRRPAGGRATDGGTEMEEATAPDTDAASCATGRTDRPSGGRAARGLPRARAEVRVDLELDEHPRVRERGDDDRGVHGADVGEGLAVGAGEGVEVPDVRQIGARADDVR